ncbi:MAG: hypothetical protein KDA41_05105 [Planctomycetales bacterium]|nr:hypothetical protein [Planctomycetales bacterium]
MPGRPLRVVKVGGSLFSLPQLAESLHAWLSSRPTCMNVLIAGGGALADAVRQFDQTQSLGEEFAHWLCVDAMSLSAQTLARCLGVRLIDRFAELQPFCAAGNELTCVFDVRKFLRHREPQCHGSSLPHGWHVTSDSIAARLAEVLQTDELVLLKSAPAGDDDIVALSRRGYVDAYFPTAARFAPEVQFVNLRDVAAPSESQPG